MKRLILASILLTTACAKSNNSPAALSAQPVGGTPALIIAPTAPTAWNAGALTTVTQGGYSCAEFTGNAVKCYDGTNIYDLTASLGGVVVTKAVVGTNTACVFTDNADPLQNVLTCWDILAPSPALVDQATQDGFAQPTYHSGATDVTVNGAGDICVSYSVFNSAYNPDHDATTCGASFTTLGYVY